MIPSCTASLTAFLTPTGRKLFAEAYNYRPSTLLSSDQFALAAVSRPSKALVDSDLLGSLSSRVREIEGDYSDSYRL